MIFERKGCSQGWERSRLRPLWEDRPGLPGGGRTETGLHALHPRVGCSHVPTRGPSGHQEAQGTGVETSGPWVGAITGSRVDRFGTARVPRGCWGTHGPPITE